MTDLRNGLALAFMAIALTAGPVSATDGVIEINQARALVGGVAAGDTAGFPVLIASAGSYRLTGNLVAPASTTAISISAADVTLDLNGFSISGSGTVNFDGVSVMPTANVELRNGTIRDFPGYGIQAGGCSGCRLMNMRLLDNGEGGAYMGPNSLIRGCTASGNASIGLYAETSSSFINNVAHDNGVAGVFLHGLGGGLIEGNVSYNNSGDGITAFDPSAVVRNNSSSANTNHGIASSGGTVVGNTSSGNGADGIHIADFAARVQGNRSTGNGDDGIQSNGVSGVSITENVATGNSYGIYIDADTTVGGNTTTGNTTSNLIGGPGIRIACSNVGGAQACP
jgi:nitrous oxidase accessory protein NosD